MSYKFVLLLLPLIAFSPVFSQQPGCTDPNAPNFDPAATVNNGSCTYGNTNYQPVLLTSLSGTVLETSGLFYWNDTLWTHNDSGSGADLFAMDTLTGAVLRKVHIRNASASDWEDIARDDMYAYIGDFGNNAGTRTDLRIYKVRLEDLSADTADAALISFTYPDQTDFSSRPQNHNFDAEAVIALGDSLYIFSKNWANLRTKVYVLPKMPGNYAARIADEMFAGGLITGADFNAADSVIVLTAYTKLLQPYIWLLWDFSGTNVLGGNRRKINFNTLSLHQVEGVCHVGGEEYFISNEALGDIPAQLYRINTTEWIADIVSGIATGRSIAAKLQLFPNPAGERLNLSWDKSQLKAEMVEMYNAAGSRVMLADIGSGSESLEIALKGLPDGMYRVVLRAEEGILTENVLVVKDR